MITMDGAGAWAIGDVLPRIDRSGANGPPPRSASADRRRQCGPASDRVCLGDDPELWLELVDRYLISAGLSEIEPVICINKADLIDDIPGYEAAVSVYRDMGHRVLLTSAVTGQGISELKSALARRLTVVAGLSGTGKSSLMAAVQPGLDIRVGAISDVHRQGRHTTAQSTLYRLDTGGYVADTPGIREFGIVGLTLGELPLYFPEIDELAADCRFSNCSHLEERGMRGAGRRRRADGFRRRASPPTGPCSTSSRCSTLAIPTRHVKLTERILKPNPHAKTERAEREQRPGRTPPTDAARLPRVVRKHPADRRSARTSAGTSSSPQPAALPS